MPKGKSVLIDYKTMKELTPARFEFLKIFIEYAGRCSQRELCDIYHHKTGYSANYGSEIISALRPLLKGLIQKKFDVDFIRIPIKSIAKFYNGNNIIDEEKD